MGLVDFTCGPRVGALRSGLLILVLAGVLVAAGVIVAQRAAAAEPWYSVSSETLGAETMVALREEHGPVSFSRAVRVALPQGLPSRLDARWTWRIGAGDWRPLPFEGTRFVGTTDGGEDLLRTTSTGRLDGTVAIERGFGAESLPLHVIESALILCEIDGRLALRPWIQCRLGGVAEGATAVSLRDEAGIEPLSLPESHTLPSVASAGIEADWSTRIDGRRFDGLLELRIVDRSRAHEQDQPLLVRLELSCDGVPDSRD